MLESKLTELYESMSRKERIGQLFQVMGHMLSKEAILTGPLHDLGLTDEDIRLAGSVVGLGSKGARSLIKIQKEFLEKHPKKIPLMFMMDIIHGYRTIYPMPLAMGGTFDPELVRDCSRMAAAEGAASGVHVTFSPMADLVRDARWGRVLESTGEDAHLNAVMVASMVKGYQGEELSAKDTMAACVKHFAAYGAPTGGRDYNTVELSERTLRDFYLPAYRAAVEAGCKLVMTAFNTVDGIPATANTKLMREILREEMGFSDVVISDFAAIKEVYSHGVARDDKDAAKLSLEAGCDIDMMSGNYSAFLDELISTGEMDEELLKESVMRVLRLKNELGLFENPYKGADEQKEREICLCDAHKELAKRAAAESFVLLKNEDDILPLKQVQKIAFIGPYIHRREMMSSWAITGEADDVRTICETAAEYAKDWRISFAKGCEILQNHTVMEGFVALEEFNTSEEMARKQREEAIGLAKECDTVVLFMGEHYLQSGEAASRSNPVIPEIQTDFLDEIHKVNPNIVLVLFTGRPLVLTGVEEKVRAILNVWMPGTMGASAIWDCLIGLQEPGGRLSMSFPRAVGQLPIHYDELRTGRPFIASSKERFQSKYLDVENSPKYVFGYGLGYTRFELGPVRVSAGELSEGSSVKAAIGVKNIGSRAGAFVAQMYIRDESASVARPVKQLRGFRKLWMEAGESREIEFEICEEMLRFTTKDNVFASEEGRFFVYIGENSDTENAAEFVLLKS